MSLAGTVPPSDHEVITDLGPILVEYRRHFPDASTDLLERAHRRAAASHEGQVRKSGADFITHPLAVALILATYGLDDETIAAALLHDVVEDTAVTLEEVEEEFGPVVVELIGSALAIARRLRRPRSARW